MINNFCFASDCFENLRLYYNYLVSPLTTGHSFFKIYLCGSPVEWEGLSKCTVHVCHAWVERKKTWTACWTESSWTLRALETKFLKLICQLGSDEHLPILYYWHCIYCIICLCIQVSVDVFKGFLDEDSIVNYTLNQAYRDNVSVFASEWRLFWVVASCN